MRLAAEASLVFGGGGGRCIPLGRVVRTSRVHLSHTSAAALCTPPLHPHRYCQFAACTRQQVFEHEAVHAVERPHVCHFCDYRANAPSKLEVHERSHTGEKPFACRWCGYRANNASAVRRHEVTVHNMD